MATKAEEERRRRAEQARAIGLWRYEIVQDLIDPALTAKQRGALARSVAERVHIGLSGEPVRISRKTIDRWLRWYRIGGFDALVPAPKQDPPRTAPEVLALAEALKRAAVCPAGADLAAGAGCLVTGLRPVRGLAPERAVAGRCRPRAGHRRAAGDLLRLPRRPQPRRHGRPVGIPRGRGAHGRRAAPGPDRPRHPSRDLR